MTTTQKVLGIVAASGALILVYRWLTGLLRKGRRVTYADLEKSVEISEGRIVRGGGNLEVIESDGDIMIRGSVIDLTNLCGCSRTIIATCVKDDSTNFEGKIIGCFGSIRGINLSYKETPTEVIIRGTNVDASGFRVEGKNLRVEACGVGCEGKLDLLQKRGNTVSQTSSGHASVVDARAGRSISVVSTGTVDASGVQVGNDTN